MKIAEGVEVLELVSEFAGMKNVVYPTVIWDENTAILIDAGYPGQMPVIREKMEKAGIAFDKLNKVIVTHQDVDHIGGLPDLLKEAGGRIEVLAHAEEKPYIEGLKPLLKMDPEKMKKTMETLPEMQRQRLAALFKKRPAAKVNTTVVDGEILPYCGGITVIYTPGHTTGHICLYLNRSKTLITGDALVASDGRLLGPRAQMTHDMAEALRSLKKLSRFDIETVVCYHGGIVRGNVGGRILELASQQSL